MLELYLKPDSVFNLMFLANGLAWTVLGKSFANGWPMHLSILCLLGQCLAWNHILAILEWTHFHSCWSCILQNNFCLHAKNQPPRSSPRSYLCMTPPIATLCSVTLQISTFGKVADWPNSQPAHCPLVLAPPEWCAFRRPWIIHEELISQQNHF